MSDDSWNLLLADDEQDIREVMVLALEDAGYRVATARDGEEALRLCEEVRPRILITDIRMPGLDGIELLTKVKERWPETEVIVMTAFGEMDLAIRALQLDASDFINKPVNDPALFLAIDRARTRFVNREKLKAHAELLEKENARTTAELGKSIDFTRNLIESSMDGILGCDEKGRVVTMNASMERMLGRPRTEAKGKDALALLFAGGGSEAFKQALASEKYGGRNRLRLFETVLKTMGGDEVPVQVSALTAGGLVAFFRDLREIHRLEREFADQARILHQDKMMSLGRLAASVVHEINNPLSGVLNYARLMQRMLERRPPDPAQAEKFREYLSLVESETDRVTEIVSNLLAFSRKSAPSFAPVNVEELVNRCALLSRHKLELAKISLSTSVQGPIPPLSGDFNQLTQCLINLILNAVDAMPEGGELGLAAAFDPEANTVALSVADTGSGISERDLGRIFEPFYTTKKQGYGVGLGLSTVFGIVESHQGQVKVESEVGRGSTFTIMLPA